MFIRVLYWEIRELLADKPDVVIHPIIGEIPVPAGIPPRMQAATMMAQVLDEKLGHDPVAPERIIKIASMRHYIKASYAGDKVENLP